MSDAIPYGVDLPKTGDPLVWVGRLLKFAGEVPDSLHVDVSIHGADRVSLWQRLLPNARVAGDDSEVEADAPVSAAELIVGGAGADAVQIEWHVGYWMDEQREPLTPGADNYVVLRINAREKLRFYELGNFELEICINSHSSEPDPDEVAELLWKQIGLSP